MPASTIAGVIAQMDAIVQRCRRDSSRLGYFAALYRNVTMKVNEGIEGGRFDDGARMERFVVLFANRYMDAFDGFQQRAPVTRCWDVAFGAASSWRLLILQHLLLSMNAHINLDLGIAAAQTAPGDELPTLKRDFDEVNDVLSEMLDESQNRLGTVSPWMPFLDRVGGTRDEALIDFSMQRARDSAWSFAEGLAALEGAELDAAIAQQDERMANFVSRVRSPQTMIVNVATFLVRLRESGDVPKVIDALIG